MNLLGICAFFGYYGRVESQGITEPNNIGSKIFNETIIKTIYVPLEYTKETFCGNPVTKTALSPSDSSKQGGKSTSIIASVVSITAAVVTVSVVFWIPVPLNKFLFN